MRIRIQCEKWMRIDADPDLQPCQLVWLIFWAGYVCCVWRKIIVPLTLVPSCSPLLRRRHRSWRESAGCPAWSRSRTRPSSSSPPHLCTWEISALLLKIKKVSKISFLFLVLKIMEPDSAFFIFNSTLVPEISVYCYLKLRSRTRPSSSLPPIC